MTGQKSLGLWLLAGVLLGSSASVLEADVFHVSTEGRDEAGRDGRSAAAAWASLAYACEQVPAGEHTIQIGPGRFVATSTARPKNGITIRGAGHQGPEATRIVASNDWPLVDDPRRDNPVGEYLIALERSRNVTVTHLALASPAERRITGGLIGKGCQQVRLTHLHVHDFRWAGIHLEHSRECEIAHSRLENASTEKFGYHNGLIRTVWIKDSRIHNNDILSTEGGGYGYKGGGHENVRIDNNVIEVVGGFSIESAHDNEYGVEIDHNLCNRCISVPKGGQGADPNERDVEYTFWIHHNILTDSYTIEGPRNHLRVSHNWIRIEKTGGRVYTHHGGRNHGPIWIHHNVVENIDRAFVWMNQGLAENIHVYNNTVFCAEAGERSGRLIDAYAAERLDGWVVRDNIFVAPASEPRTLFQPERGVADKITLQGNVCVNLRGVPEGNTEVDRVPLIQEGQKPWPYFAPATPGGLLEGVGAYTAGDQPPAAVGPQRSTDRQASGSGDR